MKLKFKRMFEADAISVGNSAVHPDGRRKRRNMERVGRDGRDYFKMKPLTSEQVQLVRDMIKYGHSERSISRTLGRSHDGVQKILKRLGLKTIFKARLDEKNKRRREAIENKLRSKHEAR